MKNSKINILDFVALLLISFCLFGNSCANGNRNEVSNLQITSETVGKNAENKQIVSTTPTNITNNSLISPVLELTESKEIKLNQPLKIHWKITNPNDFPVFIYSTLLDEKNSGGAEIIFDIPQKKLEIHFTSLTKILLEPNYFPKTEFTKIEAGKYLEGDTNSKFSILQLLVIKNEQISIKTKSKMLTGEWNIKAVIGYGEEIESIQKIIANTKGGHPIDPVVDWQKISTSEPVKIIFK